MSIYNRATRMAAVVLASCVLAGTALAEEVSLPKQMTWTNYNSNSIIFAQAVAIGEILEKHHGMKLNVTPVKSGYARVLPLLNGRADMMLTGTDGFFAQEGVFAFAKKEAGPMPLQLVLYNEIQPGNGVVGAGDAGINTPADLKGKRVAYLQGSPSSNKVVEATLAFAELTWDDVIRIPVSSFSDAHDAIINGQADAAPGNMISGSIERIANSPRGIQWAPTPHSDEEGWTRMKAVAPYIQKAVMTKGIGIPEGGSVEFNGYGFPEWLVMEDIDADTTYNLVKAMDMHYDEIAGSAPRSDGYELSRQNMQQSWPWHEGAVRYFKEKGIWSDADEAHNQMMLKRQMVLADAWKAFMDNSPPSDEAEFTEGWGKARAAALTEAGLPVIYYEISGG
ncbi:TAXI family TRAP transporter solute-binding subunit [Hoeflea prorocentri]|uniref:TAXI family TRAP transporter solute-binding subunit n=1 Tax=Hoeflea prorocentri TaxID=1922333 RepID=A0A9X3UF21_9HYPH|nr:TAXI family TRAP transporter solute-binding subunit [Hoeflea prorocentri]MCY6379690.1 TAXI family TRAP transporter solute-binding subunit [Hoeflea prorocentri]MDA5397490.1 TAXI family TRAP transporter solute-binding subunit [Hoeflea prorocentri]